MYILHIYTHTHCIHIHIIHDILYDTYIISILEILGAGFLPTPAPSLDPWTSPPLGASLSDGTRGLQCLFLAPARTQIHGDTARTGQTWLTGLAERKEKMVADAIDVSCFFGDLYVPE